MNQKNDATKEDTIIELLDRILEELEILNRFQKQIVEGVKK